MDYNALAMELHQRLRGKIEVAARCEVNTKELLSTAYTPGVAAPCIAIKNAPEKVYELTRRWNMVAVVTDGTAVLGLGDIGPEAGMPVMEGKCVLFKALGDVDAFPLCIKSRDADTIVETIYQISGSFGGINLEDISAPRCFEIEQKLKARCDIPIFHDDQHGTAVVALAALINALKVVGKRLDEIKMVVSGAGAAGTSILKLLFACGLKQAIVFDKDGMVYKGRPGLSTFGEELAALTDNLGFRGTMREAFINADAFLGVSAPNLVDKDMVRSMARDAIVFPMANPNPEITPDLALEAGAAVVGTGRSDYPNQINNVMAFPGIFRGALDVRARDINDEMKLAAAYAIASLVDDVQLSRNRIMPDAFDPRLAPKVAEAVAKAAIESGVARLMP